MHTDTRITQERDFQKASSDERKAHTGKDTKRKAKEAINFQKPK